MNDDRHNRQDTQAQFMKNMIRHTYSADPKLRFAAYTALGRMEAAESVDCLLRGMDDEQPAVRETAKRALENLVASRHQSVY